MLSHSAFYYLKRNNTKPPPEPKPPPPEPQKTNFEPLTPKKEAKKEHKKNTIFKKL